MRNLQIDLPAPKMPYLNLAGAILFFIVMSLLSMLLISILLIPRDHGTYVSAPPVIQKTTETMTVIKISDNETLYIFDDAPQLANLE